MSKSILHQLSKYQPPMKINLLEVVSEFEAVSETALSKTSDNFSLSKIAKELGLHPNSLAKVPFGKFAGILYPFKLACIYYVVRSGKFCANAEKRCDKLIKDFMNVRMAEIGREAYFELFTASLTPHVQRLMMLRILVATFRVGINKMDSVPANLRNQTCMFLKVNQLISHREAMTLIEREYPSCSIENQILGRIGYLMLWKKLCGFEVLAIELK